MLELILVGCGTIAEQVHLKNLRHLPQFRVVGLIDPSPEARARAGKLAPAAYRYATLSEFFQHHQAKAALVTTPPTTHLAVVAECLQHGLAIYLEKPLASSLADAQELVQLAQGSKSPTMLGFNLRRRPLFQDLGKAVASGQAGDIQLVRAQFSTPPGSVDWRGRPGGGVLEELASHHLDLVPVLLQRPFKRVVSAHLLDEVTATLTLELEGGIPFQGHYSLVGTLENRIELVGSRAVLCADRFRGLTLQHHGARRGAVDLPGYLSLPLPLWWQRLTDELRHPWGDRSYVDSLCHFKDCIDRGQSPSPSFTEGLRCVQLIEEIRQCSN